MKKQLPTDITNELQGSSVFFQRKQAAPDEQLEPVPEKPAQASPKPEAPPSHPARNHAITPSRTHNSRRADKHAAMQDGMVAAMDDDQLDAIRKAVKQLGKELSTHRFTVDEKEALADIVYTYTRQGWRTSENEITRIGVNWLLQDYREHGENSVLARLLERLHG